MSNNPQTVKASRNSLIRKNVYPFFWFIAAADESMLNRCPVTEQDKQASVGIAILCTTIAAMISSYYAVQSLFYKETVAVPLAIFWGLIIFNLDRFMVGSLRKDKQKKLGREIKVALPRIILAFLIAILISKPLEVKIFQHQIEAEMLSFNNKQTEEITKSRTRDLAISRAERDDALKREQKIENDTRDLSLAPGYTSFSNEYNECQRKQQRLQAAIDAKRQRRRELRANGLDDEVTAITIEIQNLNTTIRNLDCAGKKRVMDKSADDYRRSQDKKSKAAQQVTGELIQDIREKDTEIGNIADTASQKFDIASKDILGQLRILSSLKQKDSAMNLTGWLITTLFFLLELAPLLVKIFSPRGEYDTMIATSEQQAFDREEAAQDESEQEKIARKQAAIKNVVQVSELDDLVKQKVQEKILHAQTDLAEKIVDAWRKQEEDELRANPPEYLRNKIMQTSSNI
jgi:uncharacterized membrane protein